ncbi:MAG: integrase repeat-containing protein [Candidatus Magasanikbacteria bacterium]|nr:integrase repeat-containing protein [Candidatus Magasanikbacteria bacterium]
MGKNSYPTFEEASTAFAKIIEKLNLKKGDIKIPNGYYLLYYKEDPMLRSNPEKIYKKEWQEKGGWVGFLKLERIEYYSTFQEAKKAIQKLRIVPTSSREYKRMRKKDLKLPPNPFYTYPAFYKLGGWDVYLGK